MASFARPFKPSAAYLSPCRRPGMPGRSPTSSSELSLTSTASGPPGEDAADRPGTPVLAAAADEERAPAKNPLDASSAASPRPSSNSRPIAIELPKIKKLNTASVYTPPEPLSARGDLPGGYFPMHEDPRGRVHRPHPFYQDSAPSRHYLHVDSAAMQADRKKGPPPPLATASMAQASMPASPYLAPGFHDSALPMGKYYPSNYEQHQRGLGQRYTRPFVCDALSSSAKSDSDIPRHAPGSPRRGAADADAQRKMQQYQRDMIAQAAMALGGSARIATKPGTGVSLSGMPLKDIWVAAASPHKPASPRLHPLGSPGPVTPMELESGSGGYLDQGTMAHDRPSKDNLAPPGAGYTAHTM